MIRCIKLLLGFYVICACASVSAAPELADEPAHTAMLSAYLDRLLTPLVKSGAIPGAVVSIAEGDAVTSLKSYGFSDMATNQPIDPERTLMRAGSITKSFTATAILQMVDEGKIKLDDDANNYLTSIQVPASFGKTITIRQSLTHKAGFDGNISFVGTTKPGGPPPLEAWVKIPWYAAPTITVFPYLGAMLLLITTGIGSAFGNNASRKTFMVGASGSAIFLFSILLEMQFETPLFQEGGHFLPVLMWRIGWHLGLLLLAFAVFLAFQRIRSGGLHKIRLAGSAGVAVASVVCILSSGYWGLIGHFTH
jgi:hypothetical protein